MRAIHPFNHDWLFHPAPLPADAPDSAYEPVHLPHTNKLLPYHNFDDAEYQFISSYRKRFTLPEAPAGRRVYVDFDGALTATTFSINGRGFPEHRGGFTPFSYDVTDWLSTGENSIDIRLDSRERHDIPPFGHTVDYMVFGGIYRDVQLRYVPALHIVNARVRASDLLTAPQMFVDVWLVNQGAAPRSITLHAGFAHGDHTTSGQVRASIQAGETLQVTVPLRRGERHEYELWSLEHPQLYTMHLTLLDEADAPFDSHDFSFGLREAEFRSDGFYLNGQRVQLRGLNRHQNYPYIGAAAPARLQRRDADILKDELGCNIVRTSHYPQSPHFLQRCDEIGLLVFEEIPGWQHIGDADWQGLALHNVRAMITRDWNHPSIIIWGVRINESLDHHDLYVQTNALARQLDPTRQTGGVRYFQGSEFLEDVYTLNDFSNDVQEPEHTPHLITEFNGHMFPTKTWDNEERRVEHALRHAKIQARAASVGGVSGAIGWCAFDYNTHVEFGAGDRICYHGVMDIWRLPKFAAYFYASQQDPKHRIVLHAATNWKLGDVKEGLIEPIVVFSNCDEVVAYVGDVLQGTFTPAASAYPGLAHPPFLLKGLGAMLAQPYGDLKLVGRIGGEAVAEQIISSSAMPKHLALHLDDEQLVADGRDMTRLSIRATDAYGNTLPYALKVVTVTLEGPATLLGDTPLALVGGQAALYVRAAHHAGDVVIRAHAAGLPPAEIRLQVGANPET